METNLQQLLARLESFTDEIGEIREGIRQTVHIAELAPEMALTRARKVLEFVVRDVYQRRLNEPPGTRPLENLLQRLVKDGHFPTRLDAYANTVRKLGNVGTHNFEETLTATDVYQSLTQLMPILEWYFEEEKTSADSSAATVSAARSEAQKPATDLPRGQKTIAVIPKGLRSFDAEDSDFFLQLLPGPFDADGIPASIRFWKNRIEMSDELSFSVGLVYGPSGCGKSSLMKAGLLPRLNQKVAAVYVEATPDQTESRLLQGLRRRCTGLPHDLSLLESLTALRQGDHLPDGKKILLVLDQFEQWLHARRGETNTELAQALRQCDGDRLQSIVMVRDDFWVAVSRFMDELGIEILQGQNMALVDLFDELHARKVLALFGQAYERLPHDMDNLTHDQNHFLDQTVAGLAQEGKVISVRIAMLAEMLKGKPWTPATLHQVGGVDGIGVRFLDETFTQNATYRPHDKAARAVLRALLPEQGSDIKGNMRSGEQLLEASGYLRRPQQFRDLMRILDSEIRLITPTESLETDGEPIATTATPSAESQPTDTRDTQPSTLDSSYQLTHDYLVPSLRDWLTRKQKETYRGRAELRLAERAGAWNAKPENRHLPAWWELINILCFTRGKKWTLPEQKMMGVATRYHGMWGLAVLSVVLMTGLGAGWFWDTQQDKHAATLVGRVLDASPEAFPYAADALHSQRARGTEKLREAVHQETDERRKLHAALALGMFGETKLDILLDAATAGSVGECANLSIVLRVPGVKDRALDELNKMFASTNLLAEKVRYATLALHLGDSQLAAEMLALAPDPAARTALIHGLDQWHGELSGYAVPLQNTSDPVLRSGVCLAVGRIPAATLSQVEREETEAWLLDLYQRAPGAATHSASGWALRQWKVKLPEIEPPTVTKAKEGLGWHVNSVGMTMVRIPSGSFQRKDEGESAESEQVSVSRSFLLSDREVSVEQFRQFMDDKEYPGENPKDWEGEDKEKSPSPAHPAQNVNWYDAVMFCNWLSHKEGRSPCYELSGEKERILDEENAAWRLVPDANGYRLPTEAEWEYACRAATSTNYYCGDDEVLLQDYAWFDDNSNNKTWPGGEKLPNGFGLFDMHGNLWEWCYDWYSEGSIRVHRGGSWFDYARYCQSGNRIRNFPSRRYNYLGFRVASVPLASQQER